MKVVINADFGGFSISRKAAEYMAAKGNNRAIKELARALKYADDPMGGWFGFGYVDGMEGGYDRTDPDLISAIKALGDEANGDCATLKIIDIPDGIEWEIDNYDGSETIHERHRSWG